jgi:DNA-binding transcriptional LysR family regulator
MKRMELTLRKLEHALALQSFGSFSRAAEELGLTQPSLSRSISSLEEAWGVAIFERGRSGVRPTRIGTEMLQQAEQLIGLARTLDRNMQLRANAMAGPVAFGMSGLMSTVFMPGILAFLSQRSPDLQVSTRIEPQATLLDHLRNDEIEFAIYVEGAATKDPAFTSEKIGEMPIDLFVRSEHPLTSASKLRWEDLRTYPLVCSTYLQMGQVDLTPTIICDNFSVAKDFMLESDAIWLSSRFVLSGELESGIARQLSLEGFARRPNANIWLTSPVNRRRSPAGELVIEHLAKAYAEMTNRS